MSKYSSNLVKSYYLSSESGPRVIDSNSIVEEKIEKLYSASSGSSYQDAENYGDEFGDYIPSPEGEFSPGLDAGLLEDLTGVVDGDINSNIIRPDRSAPQEVYEGPSPEELLAAAQEEIDKLYSDAEASIEQQRRQGYQDGRDQGYKDGLVQAQAETEKERAAFQEEKEAMEKDYRDRVSDLEPMFVHTLTQIYEKIFNVELSEYKDIILGMLRNTMSKIDAGDNYIVHVSKDDYRYVYEHKDDLLPASALEGASLNVIEDATLRKNDCMIETAGGIYDCSLGTELKLLRSRLELLSYSGRED